MLTQVPYSENCLFQISAFVVVGFRIVLGDKIGYVDDSLSSTIQCERVARVEGSID